MSEIPTSLPDVATTGEIYGPAMEITTDAEAATYLTLLVERRAKLSGCTKEEALTGELANLGYYSGYYGKETMYRVNRLFGAAHPFFGVPWPSDPIAVQAMGTAAAEKAMEGK